MNYLQLCQRLATETRDLGGAPKLLSDGSQRTAKLAAAIQDAWLQIQLLRNDWEWILDDEPTPPQTLSGDDDVPFIAPEYHMAIVWYAVISDGYRQAATELISIGEREWNKYYGLLTRRYVAPMKFVGGGGDW